MPAFDALLTLVPGDLPRVDEVSIGLRVWTFGFTMSLVAGLACGLVPGLQASRGDLYAALTEGRRPDQHRWPGRPPSALDARRV